MTDRYRPTTAEIRTAAEQSIARIDRLTKGGQLADGRDIRERVLDPIEGAHANLGVAEKLAHDSAPYRILTNKTLTLESLYNGAPSIRLGAGPQTGKVLLTTPDGTDYRLTDHRIDVIHARIIYVPNRVRLLNRFGYQSPAELIGNVRSEAEKEARRGRTIFSRFTGRGR